MTPDALGLSDRAAMALFGLKPTRFYQLKPTLAKHCMSPIDGVWSRERIARYMAQPPRVVTRIPFRTGRVA
jgi:hypothetical protein